MYGVGSDLEGRGDWEADGEVLVDAYSTRQRRLQAFISCHATIVALCDYAHRVAALLKR
jgi:hypothetical protein